MAILNFEWGKNLRKTVEYVTKDRSEEDIFSASDCSQESAVEDFKNVKLRNHKEDGKPTFLLTQSWSPAESKLRSPEEFHAMGKQLVEELYPGHQYVIRTHTDKGHFHNHIVINTISNSGERIRNSFFWKKTNQKFIDKLRSTNDRICLDNGLSAIDKEAKERKSRIPFKAQKAERFHKSSWLVELAQKADFARAYSTSYDEYCSTLKELKIDVRVENKNISYTYPGRKSKRGSKLGKLYDKPGLEKSFQENDEKFSKYPNLRSQIRSEIDEFKAHNKGVLRDSNGLLLEGGPTQSSKVKNYSKFTSISRPGRNVRYDSDLDVRTSIIPIEEMRRAKRTILDYCRDQKIPLIKNDKGQLVLKGKEFVVVSDYEFTNTKNNRVGSLIEFVTIHQNCNYLQAISKINGNKRLLLLEEHFGTLKPPIKSFYFPKEKQMDPPLAVKRLGQFIKSFGGNPKTASSLLNRQFAQVSKEGAIRFFSNDGGYDTLEFIQNLQNAWEGKKQGNNLRPFYASKPNGKQVIIFSDPKSLIQKHGEDLFIKEKTIPGILGLLDHNHGAVDHYLSENFKVNEVTLTFSGNHGPSKTELDFFNNIKIRYQTFGIKVIHVSHDKAPTREAPSLSL